MSSSTSDRRTPDASTRPGTHGAYRLVRTRPPRVDPPRLDAAQRAVVDHEGGPLLVLAGPGTGKTTTLVEAVTRRIEEGTDPERILVLTFSRKAAVELRDRMALRIGGVRAPQASTFHSFCYALVRAHQDVDLFVNPLRLLSGPEQDVMVRELLEGELELAAEGRALIRWPEELRACLTTRGFADEVRAVLARSRELGLGPDALADFARRIGRPDWNAAAGFLAEYLDVLDAQGVLDYAELVHRAVLLARRPDVAAQLALRYDAVFVDEYQDTDPSQVRLLRALAGDGRTLVTFGDPDQSIYAFRGSDVNGILDFPDAFPRKDGRPAPVEVLTTSRRSGAELLAATRLVTRRMPLPRLPVEKVRRHRELSALREGGGVEVYTYPTPGTELDNIADLLRRAHLEDGVPWSEMAVLVRAGARTIPGIRRSLTAAGVPLEIDGDDLALRHEPAVATLLLALRAVAEGVLSVRGEGDEAVREAGAEAVRGERDEAVREERVEAVREERDEAVREERDEAVREDEAEAATGEASARDEADEAAARDGSVAPSWLSTETALTLLSSPLAGMDPADLRRLGRALRDEERAGGNRTPRPSDELLARALAEPERLAAHDPAYAKGAQRLGALLLKTRELLAGGGTAEDALWELWDGTPWPLRLERASYRGGAAGRNADRDLDAVCALFATAARAEERTGGRGALNFLEEAEAEDIAADTLTKRTVRPDAVRLMTAHRSKGLEWRLVVVAGVQEGLWPDLRRRGSLLEADRIGRDGLAEPLTPGALLAEERRLFYVAATRAKERLVVTAVKAPAEDGDQPSRFLTELGVEAKDITSRPRRPLSVASLVAELRATTVDPRASEELREAAAVRLAKLAALSDEDGRPLVPSAHPYRWWGMYEPTHSKVPLRDRDRPVALSGSALDQLANTCSLQWFLGREVKADAPASAAQGFGNVVHVLADEVASGRTPADLDVLMARLDSVWDSLSFDAPWKSAQEKQNARVALERFLRWHVDSNATRSPVASEHGFDVTLETGDVEVRIRGSMDRVETDAQGRAYVVDFKTGKNAPTAAEVERHPQLAVYQLAVREGALDEVFDGERPQPGGAELVHLRQPAPKKDGGEALPRVQAQGPLNEGEWVGDLLANAAGKVLDERFRPSSGQHCTHCSFQASCSARPEGRHIVE
ncbi:ATP-dependent helicase [Streptomyces sp. TRM66268-LWL]|uniref:DNA 3'-5' helicase n=1 Tax=Streptomyces polyasparticus TaxID=2767826 RepID=A0ABR7S6Q3_9ACTN|nr:ATP-dependent DNA helicase [Streptomyces polyasparticus]MBC9711156.1 ATP-dependent helicase [Streptomyces polyasparticus]